MNFINSIQSKLHGSINPNSVQYIRQQDLKVQLDPSGTDYVEYSGQASIFEEAHVLNPQGENTTALAILQKAPSTLPFSLASQDQFTICLKYKVHDENKPLLGYYFTTSQYDLSMNNSVFLKDDTIQVSVYKASEYPIDYAITGDLTSTDLNGATLTGTISESYTSLDYLVTSGYGQFTFTLNGTSPLQQISATVLRVYTVTVVYSATYFRNMYAIDGSTDYIETGTLVFNAGTTYVVDVSALNDTSYNVVFGTTIDDITSIVNDTSIVNQNGDNIYVYPQQTLYMFDNTTQNMTRLSYQNYRFKTSGTLTVNMTTDTVNYFLLNGGGGGGGGRKPDPGIGGGGGKSLHGTSVFSGSYDIVIGEGRPGRAAGNRFMNDYNPSVAGDVNVGRTSISNSSGFSVATTGQETQTWWAEPYDGRGAFWDRSAYPGKDGLESNFYLGAGGGGGGVDGTARHSGSMYPGANGGYNGGGKGGEWDQNGSDGAANTGGGGGGGGLNDRNVANNEKAGGAGGSGVVIIHLPEGKFDYTGSYDVTNLSF